MFPLCLHGFSWGALTSKDMHVRLISDSKSEGVNVSWNDSQRTISVMSIFIDFS